MVKDFVKDCDEMGFLSSWKLTESIKQAREQRQKDIKHVQGSGKEKEFKKKELMHNIDELSRDFDSLTARERKEKGRAIVEDIVDYGFLKDFTKSGAVEVSAAEGDDGNQVQRLGQGSHCGQPETHREPADGPH